MEQINGKSLQFFSIEKITLIYIVFTSFLMLMFRHNTHNVETLLMNRFLIVAAIFILTFLGKSQDSELMKTIRILFIGFLIAYWYPETFDFNRNFANRDYLLANWDERLFGFQPALLFSHLIARAWLGEIMYLGYFFYYLLIVGSALYVYFKNRDYFEFFFVAVLLSFFIYYLIFILFPTAGPQYYYSAIGDANVQAGIFPHIGHYFDNNSELDDSNSVTGFFPSLVERIQQMGERPTAAFPSSHVGISTLILLLLIRGKHYSLFLLSFPLYLILVFATVYIRAHYAVDVLAGFLSAIALYLIIPYFCKFFIGSSVPIFRSK